MGPFFCTKNEKIDFEESQFNVRFGECSFFTSKDTLTLSLILMYKVKSSFSEKATKI